MHGRVAIYTFTGDAQELARRAESGLLPIFKAQPGFKAYSVAAEDGQLLSMSVWGSRAEAETGNDAAAGWVAENMAAELTANDVRYGEVLFSTALGVTTAAAATA